MEFVVGDVARMGFGFANPNHAAAAICALFPFCWGWRGRWRRPGRSPALPMRPGRSPALPMRPGRSLALPMRPGRSPALPDAAGTALRPSRRGCSIFGILCANKESGNNVNNLKNNLERTLRQPARRKSARGCEPHSEKLSSQLFLLFPTRLSVADGDTTCTYTYHADGQFA